MSDEGRVITWTITKKLTLSALDAEVTKRAAEPIVNTVKIRDIKATDDTKTTDIRTRVERRTDASPAGLGGSLHWRGYRAAGHANFVTSTAVMVG